jgi:3-oxoacyl-[acyl-carrier-protein] synthase III
MDGRETFKNAVTAMQTAAREALQRCEADISQIKCFIPIRPINASLTLWQTAWERNPSRCL